MHDVRESADISAQKHAGTCFHHTCTDTHARTQTLFGSRRERKRDCGWRPFAVASNFLPLYFEAVNLWTVRAAHACHLGFSVVAAGNFYSSLHILELENRGEARSAEEDAESLVWKKRIAPLLQRLESVAAGTLSNTTSAKWQIHCKNLSYTNLRCHVLSSHCYIIPVFRSLISGSSGAALHSESSKKHYTWNKKRKKKSVFGPLLTTACKNARY